MQKLPYPSEVWDGSLFVFISSQIIFCFVVIVLVVVSVYVYAHTCVHTAFSTPRLEDTVQIYFNSVSRKVSRNLEKTYFFLPSFPVWEICLKEILHQFLVFDSVCLVSTRLSQ